MPGYALRMPFRMLNATSIYDAELPAFGTLGQRSLKIEQVGSTYALVLEPFTTQEEASAWIPRLWVGLVWMSLQRGIPFEAETRFVPPVTPPFTAAEVAHQPSDSAIRINGAFPTAYRIPGELQIFTAEELTSSSLAHADAIMQSVAAGSSAKDASRLQEDKKLQTALELYNSSLSEVSRESRFLVLVMALETLSQGRPKHPIVQATMDRWAAEVAERLEAADVLSEEGNDFEALQRELLFRKESSLRSNMRDLVGSTLQEVGHPDSGTLASDAVRMYDRRSTLVHEGFLPEAELMAGLATARTLAKLILTAKVARVTALEGVQIWQG